MHDVRAQAQPVVFRVERETVLPPGLRQVSIIITSTHTGVFRNYTDTRIYILNPDSNEHRRLYCSIVPRSFGYLYKCIKRTNFTYLYIYYSNIFVNRSFVKMQSRIFGCKNDYSHIRKSIKSNKITIRTKK